VKIFSISLSKNGKIILFFASYLLLIGFFSQINLIYLISSLLFALLITDYILSLFYLRGISIIRFCPTHVARGKNFSIELIIKNSSKFSKYLLNVTDGGFGAEGLLPYHLPVIIKINSKSQVILKYSTNIKARGIYFIRFSAIESAFPLGFWIVKKIYPILSKVVVYPEFYEIPYFIVSYRGVRPEFAGTTSNKLGKGGDFYQIREFQPGDNFKYIHWKSTAKKAKLMVRDFERFVMSNITIILDSSRELFIGIGRESNFEYAIMASATIANKALSRRYHVDLIHSDEGTKDIKFIKAYGRMTQILDALATLKSSENISTHELIKKAITYVQPNSTIVIILLSLKGNTINEILNLTKQGLEIVLILLNPRSFVFSKQEELIAPYNKIFQEMKLEALKLKNYGIRTYIINRGVDFSLSLANPI
jgi:uncharacterized protein (DUF58 family)